LGVVVRVQAINGSILVKVQNGYELDELHDHQAASPLDGQALIWQASTSQWVNQTLSSGGLDAFLLMGA